MHHRDHSSTIKTNDQYDTASAIDGCSRYAALSQANCVMLGDTNAVQVATCVKTVIVMIEDQTDRARSHSALLGAFQSVAGKGELNARVAFVGAAKGVGPPLPVLKRSHAHFLTSRRRDFDINVVF